MDKIVSNICLIALLLFMLYASYVGLCIAFAHGFFTGLIVLLLEPLPFLIGVFHILMS